MSTVVKLNDANVEPVADVVARLETALRYARKGELRSVALTGSLTGNATYTAFSTTNIPEEVGHLEKLKYQLLTAMPTLAEEPA